MTKDTKEHGIGSSSFREQILRDLEELKSQRAATPEEQVEPPLPPVDVQTATTVDEIPVSFEEPVVRETVRITGMDFPHSYVGEAAQAPLAGPAGPAFPEEDSSFVVEREPQLQDTVERNLEELRHLIAGAPSSSSSMDERGEMTPDRVLSTFPEEGAKDDSLEKTLVVEKPPVAQPAERTAPARRRTATKNKRQKQDKAASRIATGIVSVLVLGLVAVGVAGYVWVSSSLQPVDARATESISVEIPEGSSTLEIGKLLHEQGLIKNATVFNYYSKIKSYNNYKSGYYNLSQSMSVDEIAKALQEIGTATAQKPAAGKILIVEGYTLAQIAEAVTVNTAKKDEKTPFTAEQFLATVDNPDFIARMEAAYPKLLSSLPTAESGVIHRLEGYLFPAVYEYSKETTIEHLVEQMLAAMDARLQPYYDQMAEKQLSVNEVLTLASLVEKEGATDEDRRMIAQVFFNRIQTGMPLQSNIAILYAQGKLGQATTLAEDAGIDTSIESPYNIYWRAGLMPGPVDSPSLSAIEAVISPSQTDAFYFVADVTTGKVYYAVSQEEHDENVAKYVNSHLTN